MKTVQAIAAAFTGTALLATSLTATIILSESFDYPDGPLTGNGGWSRMAGTLDPSLFPVVASGAVQFDLTGTDVNYGARYAWPAEDAVAGQIYAIFDFTMTQGAQDNPTNIIPFLTFGDSTGNSQRGAIGIRQGSDGSTTTFRFGAGQTTGTMNTLNTDYDVGTTYKVMLGYDGVSTVNIWINTTNPADTPVHTRTGTNTSPELRRINLRVDTADNLGIFEIDNLVVTTVPEPASFALAGGLLALAMIVRRRRRG